ncbi:MAG: GyrI-like domain-containing protein [Arthrobacter sp.]
MGPPAPKGIRRARSIHRTDDRHAAADSGGVTAVTLPGGRAARILHTGSYDGLADTHRRLLRWLGDQGAAPGPVMWESYLTEPLPGGDQDGTKTLVTWPLAE